MLVRRSQAGICAAKKPGEQKTSGYTDGIALFLRAWDWERPALFRAVFYLPRGRDVFYHPNFKLDS